MASSKKCPMCGTKNDQDDQSCKNCGFLFEDFDLGTTAPSYTPKHDQQPPSSINSSPPLSAADNFPVPSSSTALTGSPLFVVSKSLLSSLYSTIIYLVFIYFLTSATSFNLYSIGIIVVFVLISVLPVLLSPRKYEFNESSLRIYKIIGGESEIQYSDLEIYDYPVGRRPRIVLSAEGRKRPIVISGNPTNKELGEDLSQFLGKKLKKKYVPQSVNQQHTVSQDVDMTANSDEDSANKD